MSSVVIAGNTSGTVTLQAPDIAGTTTLTLPTTSGTILTTASGQWITSGSDIYYNTGNVGIGTSSPTARLDVTGSSFATANVNFARRTDDGEVSTATTWSSSLGNWMTRNNGGALTFNSGNTIGSSVGTERMRITSAGSVGIGTNNPLETLDVRTTNTSVGSSGENGNLYIQSGYDAGIRYLTRLRTDFNGFFSISTGSGSNSVAPSSNTVTERMRIDSSGNLLVARTTTENTSGTNTGFEVDTYGRAWITTNWAAQDNVVCVTKGTPSGTHSMISFYSGGSYDGAINSNGSGISYTTASDYRLKENIAPMTGALDKVALLKPVTYTWKSNGNSADGFIAHELAEICPSAVTGEKDAVETYVDEDGNEQTRPKYQGIDTSFLVATLTAAIQEQQAIITDLKARIETLENK